jgi:dTMP kinase
MTRTRRPGGLLVAIEGIDGAGKTTFHRALRRRLRARGWRVASWHEPVDPVLGARAQKAGAIDPFAGALLFTLDRARARARLGRTLRRSDVVLSDRSMYSTLAYQASALPVSEAKIVRRLQAGATIVPDRVVWLRLAVPDALRRMERRGRRRDPLERAATLRRVARAYASLAQEPGWLTLDARLSTEALVAQAEKGLARAIAPRPRG